MNPDSAETASAASACAAGGLSARLARYAIGFDARDLPSSAINATKRAILDGVGVMMAASGESQDVRPFVELVQAQPCLPQATLLGFNMRAGALQAALVNGALAHALDYEDAFDQAPLHPNASLLPAALATAEIRPCTGREFLAAVALGCDLVCRLALSLRRPLEAGGWYPPPILGAFGATLAAARLASLDARALCDAWSLLLTQNSCPGEIKFCAESTLRAVREAFPAHAAVLSVQLAARGVRGFDAPLEGKAGFYALFAGGEYDTAPLYDDLGTRFAIEQLSFKRWPCCRGTHAYIEAAQILRRESFQVQDIEAVICAGGKIQRMLAEPLAGKRRPRTVIDAKFSIPFTVALALTEPELTLASFSAAALDDPQLLDLAGKCEFQLGEDPDFARATCGEVALRLRDGRTLRHRVSRALGEPTRPLGDTELRRKFVECVSRAASPVKPARAARYAERVLALEEESDAAAALCSIAAAPLHAGHAQKDF